MPDSITSAASSVNAAMKAAVKEIRNQIKQLQAKEKAILSVLGEPADASAASTKAKATKTTTATKNGGTKGPGMLNVLLPQMEGKAQVTSSEMLAILKSHPAYANATAGVLAAALSTEIKKGPKARVERVSKGNYRVTAAYFERPAPTPATDAPQPQVAEPTAA